MNGAFSVITGYSADEVLGRPPSVLKSGRHPPEFYSGLWAEINRSGSWSGEIWNRRRNGEIYPQWLNVITSYSIHYTKLYE